MAQLDDLPKIKIILYLDVVFVSLGSILMLGIFGYFIDLYFDSKPIGLIIAVIASFPITIAILYKRIKNIV